MSTLFNLHVIGTTFKFIEGTGIVSSGLDHQARGMNVNGLCAAIRRAGHVYCCFLFEDCALVLTSANDLIVSSRVRGPKLFSSDVCVVELRQDGYWMVLKISHTLDLSAFMRQPV